MIHKLILVCGFLFLSATTLLAQGMGTILGSVQDPSGLGVPNAKVTAIMTERGLTRTVDTDTVGDYVFPLMPVGTYAVTVEQQGFKTFRQAGIALTANANARVDIKLEVGNVVQQVSVTAAAAPVDTHSSMVGTLIDERSVTELPLDGRNVVALAALLPGVADLFAPQTFTDDRGGPTLSVAGSRDNQNLFLFDGVQFQNLFLNTGLNYPPPDALQEVKVLTNSFSAQYGHNAGSVFNVVSKSGTNKWHGAAWEFLRNDALNARNTFSSSVPSLKQNQFGATLGGPIIKDKLFIFGSYEGLRVRPSAVPAEAFPLTAQEREGYFTTAITDPTTGAAFPTAPCPTTTGTCYYVDPSRFDTVAKNVISPSVMPLPNAPGNAWIGSFPSPANDDQFMIRGDYNSGHHTVAARYNRNYATSTFYGGSIPAYQPGGQKTTVHSAVLSDTWVIRTNLLNEAHLGFNRFYSPTRLQNPTSLTALGGTFPTLSDWMTPGFSISGRLDQGDGGTNSGTATNQTLEFSDSINWTHGGHVLRAGLQYLHEAYGNMSFWETSPEFTFDGSFTGNSAADFLLGLPTKLVIASPMLQQVGRETSSFYYVQDDWRVSKRLTVNLGLRYELPLPWVQPQNYWGTLHVGQQSTVIPNAPLGMVYPGDAGVPRGLVPTPTHDFAPRIGFAYDPIGDGRTSIRGAFGMFYDATNAQIIQNTGQPFRYTWDISAPYSTTDPLYGQPAIPTVVNLKNPTFVGTQDIIYPDPTTTTPYVMQYNLNVQREVVKDLLIEVGYFGKQSRHLWMGLSPNPAAFTCLTGCANPATIANENSRAVIQPGFSVGNLLNATEGSARYNALEVQVTKRYSHRFSLQGAYTYASSLDDASTLYLSSAAPQPYNLKTQWGPSDFFQRHVASISWIWDLPGTANSNPALRQVVNGWEASGLFAVHSGEPINVKTGVDDALSGTPQQRPDEVGNPDLSGQSRSQRVAGWYNWQAYGFPTTGTYGNVGRNSLIGPGAATTSFGMFKTFPLRGEGLRLQFRTEFFNLFNRANYFSPSGNLSAGSSMFAITSADSAREIQFALKLLF